MTRPTFSFPLLRSNGQGAGIHKQIANHFSRSGCRADAGLTKRIGQSTEHRSKETEEKLHKTIDVCESSSQGNVLDRSRFTVLICQPDFRAFSHSKSPATHHRPSFHDAVTLLFRGLSGLVGCRLTASYPRKGLTKAVPQLAEMNGHLVNHFPTLRAAGLKEAV